MEIRYNNYNSQKGFQNSEIGWHEYTVRQNDMDAETFGLKVDAILEWMYSNLPMCERHCRWTIERFEFDFTRVVHVMRFKFRREQDYMLFVLRWA